jgi:hypothetical protein
MNNILVGAPYPDDETLGCGGLLLKHIAAGHSVKRVIDGMDIKVLKSMLLGNAPANAEPTKVLGVHYGDPVIKCGQEALCLLCIEPNYSPL